MDEMKDDGSAQETTSEVKQPITLEDIEKHLRSMDKIQKTLAFYMLGLGLITSGFAVVQASGFSVKGGLRNIGWAAFAIGWLLVAGSLCVGRCKARQNGAK